jgi:DNA-binding XRE family transcriptional regulator
MLKPRIKIRLAELNVKQKDLCEKLGITKQTMSLWANGNAKPTLEMAFKLAKELNCKVDDLYSFEEN